VKQSRNFSQSNLTIGLDLGDRSSCYCVLDESGRIVMEPRVSTTMKALRAAFGAMPRSRIALEIGTHSPGISRLLGELGHEVIVANARKVRLIGESRKKDDRLDAQTPARLARIDPQLLCPVKHRSAKAQADLTVIRARAGLVVHLEDSALGWLFVFLDLEDFALMYFDVVNTFHIHLAFNQRCQFGRDFRGEARRGGGISPRRIVGAAHLPAFVFFLSEWHEDKTVWFHVVLESSLSMLCDVRTSARRKSLDCELGRLYCRGSPQR
jgi:hypothetical protein